MATINQVEKTDYTAVKVEYTNKDYINILDDLINSISGISQKWNTTDENDTLMIIIKLMAILGDMMFYTQDMQSLEVYPASVTQRKNAASIYKLIGYKMRWYKSATLECNLVNTYTASATIPRFCTFTTENNTITYCTFEQIELASNTTNNGLEQLVTLVQGVPVTPVRTSNNPYPETGKPWHSIYGYNYTAEDIINNRIYLNDTAIDQDHIILIDDQNEEWVLKDNIYLTTDVGRFFEFGVDVNDQPYLELVDYYTNFNVKKFKIFYVRSLGEDGQIYANMLKNITGNVWSRTGTSTTSNVYNVSNFIYFTNYDSTLGYNPETPDEARKNSVIYQNTLDTLITLADFERATLREIGVANVRATDLTNDPGTTITHAIGNITMDTTITVSEDGETTHTAEVIDYADVEALTNYLANPTQYPLTTYQLKLADVNQDGIVNSDDLDCLNAYLEGDYVHSGYAGIQQISTRESLDGFVVKLYILREEAWEDYDDETYESMILSDLQEYKILPLTIEIDLHSINKYYWSITGKFLTKQPLSRDDLQNIIVSINNDLKYKYSLDKVNFNTAINYKEVIETILAVDSRILMVDLEPIEYKDANGNTVTKSQVTGEYIETVPMLTNNNPANNVHYNITLPNYPILPGSVMVRVNGGEYTLTDNNNGQIYNIDNILVRKGSIDYMTGELDLEFTSPVTDDLVINYTKNEINIATYRNLSTQTFYFDSSSLQKDDMQDLV